MSETTERELKTAKLLAKEKAKHAETKSDAFFGARMAVNLHEVLEDLHLFETVVLLLLASLAL